MRKKTIKRKIKKSKKTNKTNKYNSLKQSGGWRKKCRNLEKSVCSHDTNNDCRWYEYPIPQSDGNGLCVNDKYRNNQLKKLKNNMEPDEYNSLMKMSMNELINSPIINRNDKKMFPGWGDCLKSSDEQYDTYGVKEWRIKMNKIKNEINKDFAQKQNKDSDTFEEDKFSNLGKKTYHKKKKRSKKKK